MAKKRSALVLINRKSGTVRSMGPDKVESAVHQGLHATFQPLKVEFVDGDITPVAKRAVKAHAHEVIIVGGGDGSISSLANVICGTDVIMGALPLGTMNIVAQDLGFSPRLVEALQQLATAHVTKVDVGKVNGHVFLHQVSFGLQPRMARLRERFGYQSRLQKMLSAARAYLSILLRPRMVRVSVRAGEMDTTLAAPFLAVTNNPLNLDQPLSRTRRLDQGTLGFYAVRSMSLAALLRLASAYLRGQLRQVEHFESSMPPKVLLNAGPQRFAAYRRKERKPKAILASIDGELSLLEFPVTLEVLPRELRVLSAVVDEGAARKVPTKVRKAK